MREPASRSLNGAEARDKTKPAEYNYDTQPVVCYSVVIASKLNRYHNSKVRLPRIKNKQIRAAMVRICLSWLLLLDLNQ